MIQNREDWFDGNAALLVDRAVRKRLSNWGDWQKLLQKPQPSGYPNPQPMFRGVKSGWNVEDVDAKQNLAANFDDAYKSEQLICMMSKHNQSVLWRYFVKDQNTVECAKRVGMSQRKFEQWLMQAIGQVTQLMTLYQADELKKAVDDLSRD